MKANRFRGLEIAMDNIRMQEHLLPSGFNVDSLSYEHTEYFLKYGFKVPKALSELYYRYNGIKSEKYISDSIYFYYISPFLINMNLSTAFVDKNMYYLHFPNIRQPETVLHCAGRRYYTPKFKASVSRKEVIAMLLEEEEFIIKPSIYSGRGRDVQFINVCSVDENDLSNLLDNYCYDFIVQRPVVQHSDLCKLNPTSLNTLRLYTYNPHGGGGAVLLGAAIRFGGEGAFRDNACTGGGFCKIYDTGLVDDKIFQYRSLAHLSLNGDKGISKMIIPSYEKAVSLCLNLQASQPYIDLIGWDIAIDIEGNPVLIELNQYPDTEFIQICNGPMFGDYTDDLMERVSKHKTEEKVVYKRSFGEMLQHYAYNFEIGKQFSI